MARLLGLHWFTGLSGGVVLQEAALADLSTRLLCGCWLLLTVGVLGREFPRLSRLGFGIRGGFSFWSRPF